MCYNTTAGLGYWKVVLGCTYKTPQGTGQCTHIFDISIKLSYYLIVLDKLASIQSAGSSPSWGEKSQDSCC
jgi:hypothetical protein